VWLPRATPWDGASRSWAARRSNCFSNARELARAASDWSAESFVPFRRTVARFFNDLLNGLVSSLMGTPLGFKAERLTVSETTLLNKMQERLRRMKKPRDLSRRGGESSTFRQKQTSASRSKTISHVQLCTRRKALAGHAIALGSSCTTLAARSDAEAPFHLA
jgi:hypothetical protein